jgi:hypothetical protein
MWIIVVFGFIFLVPTLFGILTYGYGIFALYMELCFCSTVLLILIYMIWWNYFSAYPSFVQISQGCISVQFRRVLRSNRIINITSQTHPSVLASSHWFDEIGLAYYYARVQVESTNNHSIVIYHQLQSSEKQSDDIAIQLAKSIASKSGFLFKHIGCGLTSGSS